MLQTVQMWLWRLTRAQGHCGSLHRCYVHYGEKGAFCMILNNSPYDPISDDDSSYPEHPTVTLKLM